MIALEGRRGTPACPSFTREEGRNGNTKDGENYDGKSAPTFFAYSVKRNLINSRIFAPSKEDLEGHEEWADIIIHPPEGTTSQRLKTNHEKEALLSTYESLHD